MKTVIRVVTLVAAVLFLLYVSFFSLSNVPTINSKITVATLIATPQASAVAQSGNINDIPLRDNPDVYKLDDPSSVVTIYVTVRKGSAADKTDFTWKQINDFTRDWWTNGQVIPVGKAEAIVQFGDDTGPLPGEVGYSAIIPNATIALRGSTSSLAPQKSYKIELFKNAGTWRGQSTIDLNKHIWDPTRFKNKLSFDLLKEVPDMVSLRTQFIHLYVKDETSDPAETKFVDYGLYTQVEQPNKKFLASRFLDTDGQLYKANDFKFYRYPDQIRLVTDPLYNADDFSLRLEIKGNNDNTKLVQMLDDVNNMDIPIEQTFEKYFNADNYFTWMAFNILVGNLDTNYQNFFLYSPKNGEKWYFLPWDYDGAFPLQNHPEFLKNYIAPWQNGVSNYWDVLLHRRVLMVGKYRDDLDKKIDELLDILAPDRVEKLINIYQPTVDKYISELPDSYYLPVSVSDSHRIATLMLEDVDTNYQLYADSLTKPMPFSLGTPQIAGGKLHFTWDASYDFDGQAITYKFALGKDWNFQNVIFQQDLVDTTAVDVDMLPPGKYFWRVLATNESGKSQVSFDSYIDDDSIAHPGVKNFYITPGGQVEK